MPERHAEGTRDGRTRVDSTTAESARCPRVSGCAHSREPTNILSGRRGRGSAREICDTRVCGTCAFTYRSPRPRGHNNDRGMTDSAAAPRAPTPLEFAKLQSRLAIAESARRASGVRLEELERAHEREREKGAARVAELSARLDLERRRADAMEAREVEQERARASSCSATPSSATSSAPRTPNWTARETRARRKQPPSLQSPWQKKREKPPWPTTPTPVPPTTTSRATLPSSSFPPRRRSFAARRSASNAERETQATRRRSEGVRDQFIESPRNSTRGWRTSAGRMQRDGAAREARRVRGAHEGARGGVKRARRRRRRIVRVRV